MDATEASLSGDNAIVPSTNNVDRIYQEVRAMAAEFRLKPEERINEGALARLLGASRTPVREALNRLVAEGFLTLRSGQGFFCRAFTPDMIADLYEARVAIEVEAVRLATIRATPVMRGEIRKFLEQTAAAKAQSEAIDFQVGLDEAFHLKIADASGNQELVRLLDNLNGRIRFVRWIDMERRSPYSQGDHMAILDLIDASDPDAAATEMRSHVQRRGDEIAAAVAAGYSKIYMPDHHHGRTDR